MAEKIFISYRRDDVQAFAGRIGDELKRRFGDENVFMDVSNLRPGDRFDRILDDALAESDVFLAVIGPKWLELLQSKEQEEDYLRREVASAITREMLKIPLVIEGARLPNPKNMPPDVSDLVKHQYQKVAHDSFRQDVESFVQAIESYREKRRKELAKSEPTPEVVSETAIAEPARPPSNSAGVVRIDEKQIARPRPSAKRIALVVGNSQYLAIPPLATPGADAALLTARLSTLGFKIIGGVSDERQDAGAGRDTSVLDTAALTAQFVNEVQSGSIAVIYYAGHAIQVGDQNYIVPVDCAFDPSFPDLGLINLRRLVEAVSSKAGETGSVIVFLDACRDYPLNSSQSQRVASLLGRGDGSFASVGHSGLSAIKFNRLAGQAQTFIGFAATPGEIAYSGMIGATNSPFASALDRHLAVSGLELEELFRRVTLDVNWEVARDLDRRQTPWSESDLYRGVLLNPRRHMSMLALASGSLLTGALVFSALFRSGQLVDDVWPPFWGLGLLMGSVLAFGTIRWGAGAKVFEVLLAFLGPGLGFALALAMLHSIPPFESLRPPDAIPPSRELAFKVYSGVLLIGGVLYLISSWRMRRDKGETWPRTGLGWLNFLLTWLLPFVIVALLWRLGFYIALAAPEQTVIGIFCALGGIIYAASVPLALRVQGGEFSSVGPLVGSLVVGILGLYIFFVYDIMRWTFGIEDMTPGAQVLLVALGTAWHGLLGAQVGYCFAYYVPDYRVPR